MRRGVCAPGYPSRATHLIPDARKSARRALPQPGSAPMKGQVCEGYPMLDLTYEAPKPKVIAGAKHDWELVIGMEIHAQVSSNAKLFSGASTTVPV